MGYFWEELALEIIINIQEYKIFELIFFAFRFAFYFALQGKFTIELRIPAEN